MSIDNITLWLLAQSDDDSGSSVLKILIPLLIMGLAALSNLLKRKQEQPPPPPRTSNDSATQPRQSARPVPTYARGRHPTSTSSSTQPVARQGVARPAGQTTRQTTGQAVPRSGSAQPPSRPIRSSNAGRSGPTRQARQTASQPVPQRSATATAQAHLAASKSRTTAKSKVQQQLYSTAEAAKLRRAGKAKKTVVQTPRERLNQVLDQPSALVRAVVAAEIIGKPVGLRPSCMWDL